ncbi:MAG: GC-type dockerin domain-anchored protein [Phycisphaerales bacterium]
MRTATLAILTVTLIAPSALAQLSVERSVFAGGGGVAGSANFSTHATAGEGVISMAFGGGLEVSSGFWAAGGLIDCRADLDGDGTLTIFDFLAFQNLFSAGDPRADFDGDGSLTLFDFLAFQNEFAAGCP